MNLFSSMCGTDTIVLSNFDVIIDTLTHNYALCVVFM